MLDITFNIQNYANGFNISYSVPIKIKLFVLHAYLYNHPLWLDVVMCIDIDAKSCIVWTNQMQNDGLVLGAGDSVSIRQAVNLKFKKWIFSSWYMGASVTWHFFSLSLPRQSAQLWLDLLRDDMIPVVCTLWHYLEKQIPNPCLILWTVKMILNISSVCIFTSGQESRGTDWVCNSGLQAIFIS